MPNSVDRRPLIQALLTYFQSRILDDRSLEKAKNLTVDESWVDSLPKDARELRDLASRVRSTGTPAASATAALLEGDADYLEGNNDTLNRAVRARQVLDSSWGKLYDKTIADVGEAILVLSASEDSGAVGPGGATTGVLKSFGVNVTEQARRGQLDPVIGRSAEVQCALEVLIRHRKNNPVFVGEAGVGKTALVEGLAQRIAAGDVPFELKDKEIYSINMGVLQAGTNLRGDFEKRVQDLLTDVAANPNAIVFIDELHTIVGAGRAEGVSADLANMIKPQLERGGIKLIGATTLDEYRKYIEKDPALARRFQTIQVNPPSVEDTIGILKGIRKTYEEEHHVTYSDEALETAAKLADKYIQDRFMPDKAIDLIDQTAAHLRIVHPKNERQAVNPSDIAETVSRISGIPVGRLTEAQSARLLSMEDHLHERIIGQDQAVTSVSNAVIRSAAGISDHSKPRGSFCFVGPSGAGKTELAKALAEFLFDDETAMVRLDMSEYKDKSSTSKLIGAAPGFIGYEEGGQLTERVRRHPHTVLLLDEIEKAHPEVFDLLLQVLSDGRLTDGQGRTVSFKDTLVILTSNLPCEIPEGTKRDRTSESIAAQLKRFFRPEFVNRVDEFVLFSELTEDQLLQIVNIKIGQLNRRLAENSGLQVSLSEEAKRYLARNGIEPGMGARPLAREIQRDIEDPLAKMSLRLSENDRAGKTVQVDYDPIWKGLNLQIVEGKAPNCSRGTPGA